MKFLWSVLLLGLVLGPSRAEADGVLVELRYVGDGGLEVSYDLPETCARLFFQRTGAGYAQIRASWQSQDQCASVNGQALSRTVGKACRTARFRVPVSTDKVTGYPGAFPIGDAIYAHTSKYAVSDACGSVNYQFVAPGSIAVQGELQQHVAKLDDAKGADAAVLLLPHELSTSDGMIAYFDPALSAATVARIKEVASGTIDYLRAELPDAAFSMPVVAASVAQAPGDANIGGDAGDVLRLTLFNWPADPGPALQQQLTRLVAHEFSHRFQLRDAVDGYADARLIHEGGGEFLRWMASVKRGWLSHEQAARDLDESLAECMIGTGADSWARLSHSFTARNHLDYSCGLAIYVYALAARQGSGSAMLRFNGFYKALVQGAAPDFGQALECGDKKDCSPRWLPELLGTKVPMQKAWETMLGDTGLALESAPNASESNALVRTAIVELIKADCDGQSSTTVTAQGLLVDGLPACATLRKDAYVTTAEGMALFERSSRVLAALTVACNERGEVRLGAQGGASFVLACKQTYQARSHFYRVDIERVLSALDSG